MGRELSLYGSWGENFISTLTPTQEDSLNRHSDRKDGREIHSQLAHLLRPSQVDVSTRREVIQMSRWFLMIRLSSKLTRLSSVLAVQSSRRSLRVIPVNILWCILEEFRATKWSQYYSSCISERENFITRE